MAQTLTPNAASVFGLDSAHPLTRLRVITDRPRAKPPETWHKNAGSPLQQALLACCDATELALMAG